MFPEEKFGPLELEGEVNGLPEEEDTSDAPTMICPNRQYHQNEEEDKEGYVFWPFL